MQERRYDIDWLRIIAMLAIFLYHCTRFFDTEGWELKNQEQSELLFVLMRGLIWPWAMELFFLLSGVGTWYAFKSRSAGTYVWERFKRLLIPLYTVGFIVLLPIQFYFKLFYRFGVSRQLLAGCPELFRKFQPTKYNGVAQYPIAHPLFRSSVVSPVSLSDFAAVPSHIDLSKIRTRPALGRETCRME